MRIVGVAMVLCMACSPEQPSAEPQVVLYVDTDAPLPPAPGDELGWTDHPALFDTLRVDVLEPGVSEACPDCVREVAVDRDMFRPAGASFGILMAAGREGYRVRLRLFNTRHRVEGEPSPYSSIDAFVSLPAVGPGETAEHHVVLSTDSVAKPQGSLDAPIDPQPGPITKSRVGTWIQRRPCRGSPREGEVCVPGGAYWMGDPRNFYGVAWPVYSGLEQRLVVLSPFFLDATEVTVGQFHPNIATDYVPWTKSSSGDTEQDFCTWSEDPERASYPMNCVAWYSARGHCLERGADLPTEAQYEYVASGMRGHDFVWGNALPDCDDAVWGRGPIGTVWKGGCRVCRDPQAPAGAVPWGTGEADRLALPGGVEVVNLAGSVREWCRDKHLPTRSYCWPSGVVHDPVCDDAVPFVERSARGGSWNLCPVDMEAAMRTGALPAAMSPTLGFRCARPDVEAP